MEAGGLKGGCIRIGRTRICGAKGGAIVGNRVNRIHDDNGDDDVEGIYFAITIWNRHLLFGQTKKCVSG